MAAVSLVGCNGTEDTDISDTVGEGTSDTAADTAGGTLGTEIKEDGGLHVLITSDVHLSTKGWYGVADGTRMQLWVDSIKAEHEKNPYDLIIIAGDTSLDYYGTEGTYTKNNLSMTKRFMSKYVSQLPADVPVFVMPGNHEAYTNEKWKEITGQDRQQSYAVKGNLFIMLDTFGSEVGDKYDGDAACTPVDVNYIKEQMAANPDCSKVWLIAHYFDTKNESEEFKALLKTEKRIKGLFAGHTHKNGVIELGEEFGGHRIAQCGNFSYSCATAYPTGNAAKDLENLKNSMWGFRELNITADGAVSSYIIVKSNIATYNGQLLNLERRSVDSVRFY